MKTFILILLFAYIGFCVGIVREHNYPIQISISKGKVSLEKRNITNTAFETFAQWDIEYIRNHIDNPMFNATTSSL